MNYEDWRAVPSDQLSRQVPALCFSPASRQKRHRGDGVIGLVSSSGTSAVAHCVYEYKNPANVRSGERSQEITFDFIQAEAGILRRAKTIPGHRYQIEAWGKHVRSQSQVELSLGVDEGYEAWHVRFGKAVEDQTTAGADRWMGVSTASVVVDLHHL
jgi:hypothetical protein